MDVRLTFENHSLDVNRTEVFLFQRDRRAPHELPVVWKVIRGCGYECTHPFLFPSTVELAVYDAWGHCFAQPELSPGDHVWIRRNGSGATEAISEPGNHGLTGVSADSRPGALHVFLARDGRAVTPWRTLPPGTSTFFDVCSDLNFLPWNGLNVGETVPREALAMAMGPDYAFNLLGISKARILMLGGGWGPRAQRLRFHLHQARTSPFPY